jgi:hypothetical protein
MISPRLRNAICDCGEDLAALAAATGVDEAKLRNFMNSSLPELDLASAEKLAHHLGLLLQWCVRLDPAWLVPDMIPEGTQPLGFTNFPKIDLNEALTQQADVNNPQPPQRHVERPDDGPAAVCIQPSLAKVLRDAESTEGDAAAPPASPRPPQRLSDDASAGDSANRLHGGDVAPPASPERHVEDQDDDGPFAVCIQPSLTAVLRGEVSKAMDAVSRDDITEATGASHSILDSLLAEDGSSVPLAIADRLAEIFGFRLVEPKSPPHDSAKRSDPSTPSARHDFDVDTNPPKRSPDKPHDFEVDQW